MARSDADSSVCRLAKSRSKTSRGLISLAIGVVATARRCSTSRRSYSPSRSCPPGRRGRCPARARGTGCALPIFCAATWSTETPARMLAPSVLSGWTPVRKQASDRAWSPPPSPWAKPFVLGQAAEDEQVVLERRRAARGWTGARSSSPPSRASSPACGRRWGRRRTPSASGDAAAGRAPPQRRPRAPSPPARAGRSRCPGPAGPSAARSASVVMASSVSPLGSRASGTGRS